MIENLHSQTQSNESDVNMRQIFRLWLEQLARHQIDWDGTLIICGQRGRIVDTSTKLQEAVKQQLTDFLMQSWNQFGSSSEHSRKDKVPTATVQSQSWTAMAVPIETDDFMTSLLCIVLNGEPQQSDDQLLRNLGMSLSGFMQSVIERDHNRKFLMLQQKLEAELNKKDFLFQLAEMLHTKIDGDSVLIEVMDSIQRMYPSTLIELYLSQDNSSALHVKPLSFQNAGNDISTRAYMQGTMMVEPPAPQSGNYSEIAAPLSGKQGVYGVFHLRAGDRLFDESDVRFFAGLAETAGFAFEKAKLYEQSNVLINELRLINEITKRLNQSLKLNDVFNFASSELIRIFGAEFSCILELDSEQGRMIVQASNLPAMYNDDFSLDYGFSGIVYRTREPIIISDYWSNPQVKSKLMDITGSRSLIASPILVNEEAVGVILVAHRKPNYFSYDNYKLLQVLCVHIGLAMTNASLHAEVRRMVITDNLTGLYVRHYLDEQVNGFQKKDFCGALIVVDIDHFKQINDTYGHQIGDRILIQVSNIIKSSIRHDDIASRWGGEELAIYLPQANNKQAWSIAERIRVRVYNETDPQVSVSCGVSDWSWEDGKISVESLFYKADMALYEAKNNGRNCVKISEK